MCTKTFQVKQWQKNTDDNTKDKEPWKLVPLENRSKKAKDPNAKKDKTKKISGLDKTYECDPRFNDRPCQFYYLEDKSRKGEVLNKFF